MREMCLSTRHVLKAEQLSRGTKQLQPLLTGEKVAVQDQAGNTPRRWTITGTIIEVCPHSSYLVRVDGSNRVTRRNCQFLRKIIPYSPTPSHPVQSSTKPIQPAPAPALPTQYVHTDPVLPIHPDPVVLPVNPDPVLPVQHVHPVSPAQHVHAQPAQPVILTVPSSNLQPVRKKPIRERWFLAKDLHTPQPI